MVFICSADIFAEGRHAENPYISCTFDDFIRRHNKQKSSRVSPALLHCTACADPGLTADGGGARAENTENAGILDHFFG
jgi:hypothetical protein